MYILTKDGKRYLDFDESQSIMLSNMKEDTEDGELVPLPNVDSKTLDKIIEWQSRDDEIDEPWSVTWSMAHAADYLNIPGLLQRTCTRLADLLRGKSPRQIQELIGDP
jgi:hypothetical protein